MIASESSFEWIRDARLLFMLNSFDEFSTRIQIALDVEEEDKEEVAPLVSREDIAASVQDVEWQNENAFQRQRAPTQAEQTISVVNINDDEIEDDKDEDVIADVHQATPPSHQFYFTHFILEQLMETDFFNERYFLLYTISHRIVLIAMYIVMLLTVTNTRRDVSYLTKNLHSGLRDLPYRQSCNDVNCTVGFTKRWTFSDNERLEHLRMFAHRRLQYSLFRTSIPSAAQSDETVPNFSGLPDDEVVSWDSYIVRNGPIEIRQMRGKKIECPPLPAFVAQRLEDAPHAEQQRLRTFNCSSALDMQQDLWLPKPEGSLLDEDAYRFQAEYCAEDPIQKTFTVHGFYNTHWPCMGYTATVHNASQLLYAIDHWLSGDTRFVAIAMKFSSSGKGNATVLSTKALVESAVSVQYVMYAEFAQGGASGQFFVRTTALKDPFLDTLSDTGIVLMSIDFAFGLIGVLIPLLYAYRHARQRLHKKRILSLRTAVYIIYIGLVSDHLRNSGDAGGDNSSTTAVLAALILVVWLTLAILFDVIFPAALFVFRRVTIVNDFIALAFLRVVQLVPLFSILVTAFTIAGHIMWGSRMHEFATLYHSLLAVLEGLLGDFDLVDDMFALDATYAFVFTLLMLVVMVILALNLLLAVIAGCAEEAREHTKIVGAIEAVAAIMNRRIYFGPMFGVLMGKFLGKSKKRERLPLNAAVATAAAASLSQGARDNNRTTVRSKKPLSPLQYEAAKNNLERILERRSLPVKGVFGFLLRFLFPSENGFRARLMRSLFRSTSTTAAYADETPTLHDATLLPPLELHTTEVARLPLPLECLAQHIPPLLFYELVDCLHIGRQPESMQCSSVAFLLQQFQVFSKHFPERSYLDSLKESALSKQLQSKPQRRPITSSLKQGACLQQNAQPRKAQATLEKPPRAVAEARDERRKSKSRNTILEVKDDVVVPSTPTLNTSARSVHRGSRGQSSAVSTRRNDELMDLLLK